MSAAQPLDFLLTLYIKIKKKGRFLWKIVSTYDKIRGA